MTDAVQTVEQVARSSYGRLVAYLAARSRDLAAAEDALAEAFLAALAQWPRDGVPQKPEAWLLTAARRRMIDATRRSATADAAFPSLEFAALDAQREADAVRDFPDERLGLLFCCAHPAIDEACGPDIGLTVLNGLNDADIADCQPYWAVRGHLLAHAGRAPEARVAYTRAIHLSDDVAVRSFLVEQARNRCRFGCMQ